MNTITKLVTLGLLCLLVGNLSAQDNNQKTNNQLKIESLEDIKEIIQKEERDFLKKEVEDINQRLDNGEITKEKAEELKQEAAQRRALNIENRIAIIDNRIELLKRNAEGYDTQDGDDSGYIGISFGTDDDSFKSFRIKNSHHRYRKYDKRTTSAFVFAMGINNTISDGSSLGDTYEVMGSGFEELGWAWKTRVFDNSNAVRFRYGFSFQWNKLSPKNNQYFVQNGDLTTLEEFPSDLRQSSFRVTNLVFPIHFEFGPSKKIERENYFRYSTRDRFKIGIGGYAGFNIGTKQKLRYKVDGDRVKEKISRDYNTSDFVYGLSGYIGVDDVSLYVKYDLNPFFKDQAFDQRNISIGIRLDID
jgi:hypothetical protein